MTARSTSLTATGTADMPMALSGSHLRYLLGVVTSTTQTVSTGVKMGLRFGGFVITSFETVLGDLILGRLLGGIVFCATAVIGGITVAISDVIRYLGGIIICATTVPDQIAWLLGGIINCSTAVIGNLRQSFAISGIVSTATTINGRLGQVFGLRGSVVSSTSAILGAITGAGTKLISGIITSATSVLGGVTRLAASVQRFLGGVIICATTAADQIGWLIGGTIQCSTALNAAVINYLKLFSGVVISSTSMVMGSFAGLVKLLVGGIVACATFIGNYDPTAWFSSGWFGGGWFSDFSGVSIRLVMKLRDMAVRTNTVILGGIALSAVVQRLLSGIITCSTSVVVNVQKLGSQLLSGIIVCATHIVGQEVLGRFVSGAVSCGTTVLGSVVRGFTFAGTILSSTAVSGCLVLKFIFGGVIICSTTVMAALSGAMHKFIGGVIVCNTYVYMGFVSGFSTAVTAGRHFIDFGRRLYIKARQHLKIKL